MFIFNVISLLFGMAYAIYVVELNSPVSKLIVGTIVAVFFGCIIIKTMLPSKQFIHTVIGIKSAEHLLNTETGKTLQDLPPKLAKWLDGYLDEQLKDKTNGD
jgi:hypothetical protein